MKIERIVLSSLKAILVIGPAEIEVVNGEFEIFGRKLISGRKVSIAKYKAYPVECTSSQGELKITLGVGGRIEEKRGIGTYMWRNRANEVVEAGGDCIVIGGDDSGKTSLTTYIANLLFKRGVKCGVIDADPGQGDLAQPCMIGAAIIGDEITSLCDLTPVSKIFIGKTSPHGVERMLEDAINKLYERLKFMGCERIVINFHGWIKDQRATQHIVRVIKKLNLRNVLLLKEIDEHYLVEDEIVGINTRLIPFEKPNTFKRSLRDRRSIRERKYMSYFSNNRGFKVIEVSDLSIVKGSMIFKGSPLPLHEIKSILRVKRVKPPRRGILYGEKINERVNILVTHNGFTHPLRTISFEFLGLNITIYLTGKEIGLLSGFTSDLENWELGKLLKVTSNRTLVFLAPKNITNIKEVVIGRLVLDSSNREAGTINREFFS